MKLRSCTRCHQHFKPDEPSCPHCGQRAPSATVALGVAAALAVVGCTQPAEASDHQVRPLYGVPPMRKPVNPTSPPSQPVKVDAGAADAGEPFGLHSK